uniref:Uncharacterized protein n=1 Tax=Arundo donax TaxID=35708 RepID=A0A0A9D0A0_ARUDO
MKSGSGTTSRWPMLCTDPAWRSLSCAAGCSGSGWCRSGRWTRPGVTWSIRSGSFRSGIQTLYGASRSSTVGTMRC